jgi:hypothetical protein
MGLTALAAPWVKIGPLPAAGIMRQGLDGSSRVTSRVEPLIALRAADRCESVQGGCWPARRERPHEPIAVLRSLRGARHSLRIARRLKRLLLVHDRVGAR